MKAVGEGKSRGGRGGGRCRCSCAGTPTLGLPAVLSGPLAFLMYGKCILGEGIHVAFLKNMMSEDEEEDEDGVSVPVHRL